MARPSIITDSLIERFGSIVRSSHSIKKAIEETGIGRESYYRWKRRVSNGDGTLLETRFIGEVNKAEGEVRKAQGEIKMLYEYKLSQHFDKNWKALAWWLSRKYPNEYGKRRPPPLPDPDAC